MSFERRIALLAGGAVAVAILVAAIVTSILVESALRAQVDDSLRERAAQYAGPPGRRGGRGPFGFGRGRPGPPRGGPAFIEQLVTFDGRTQVLDEEALPAPVRTGFQDVEVRGEPARMLVVALPGGGAVQVARSLAETDAVVGRLRLVLLLIAVGGVGGAGGLGLVVARRAARPVRRLTEAAERVARTQDLTERIDVAGTDELAQLAARFNEMLDALDRSIAAQRALFADASHELRTPVTALRTNIEVLQANPGLDPDRRTTLLERAKGQTEELTRLVNDVIEVARGEARGTAFEPVRLDELVDEAVARARRDAPPGRAFDVELEETVVDGDPARLGRAVRNLLDNAVKFGGAAGPVEVRLAGGTLTVRDHGPGIPADELALVFDRFFRGAESRDRPGSGLGLAIVRQVAQAHGGTATAANHPDGGAELTLCVPSGADHPTPSGRRR